MIRLIKVLYHIKLLSPVGLYRLVASIYRNGINLMTLLKITGAVYGDKVALVDEDETVSYKQLLSQSEKLAIIFKEKFQLKAGQKVGFLCKNHASMVKAIFATSRLGPDIYLLNTEMSKMQLKQLVNQHDFDFLIIDFELSDLLEDSGYSKGQLLSTHKDLPAINHLLHGTIDKKSKLQQSSSGKIMLLTSGTTGKAKEVAHKPSLFNFLNPFLTLLTRLKLFNYHTAYIATPIFHGYGIAILVSCIALGKKVIIRKDFHVKDACQLIREHNIEVVTVVPLMIHKMLETNASDLTSLRCIASGGSELNTKLVEEVFHKLGAVIYNLYGTSEAGLNMIATPQDLQYSTSTIGRKIEGVQLKILDQDKEPVEDGMVGQFCIKNRWSMRNSKNDWIETGDLGYIDKNGYYFLRGRTDDMVVSAGENVYPIEIEQLLIHHPLVDAVAVIGIHDEQFGQRLQVFVQPVNAHLTKEALIEWLHPRVARFQMPKDIVFVASMPYTSLGKLDKKKLRQAAKIS
ncbi:AMP-dependent synthetase [Lysinibacillus contaminans]|uniref:AMP-dependent synthetase n=1 Tax=Lysinibacillus contaminans TaxID=1293441 RepID=A0ABR5K4W2_9BACI|nr:AMP-dependent synthetase [Lysinibacillus contaminans]